MTNPTRLLAIALTAASLAGPAAAHLPDYLAPRRIESRAEPQTVVQDFLAAVERGDLWVLGVRIERTAVVPRRVEYVYDLDLRTSTVKVYAELRPPLPVTGQEPCEVRGVSALLDEDGRILESEAHVWCQ